jgi:hypothetical protein
VRVWEVWLEPTAPVAPPVVPGSKDSVGYPDHRPGSRYPGLTSPRPFPCPAPRHIGPTSGWHHVFLCRLEAALARDLWRLGPPRAGATSNSSLHFVVWVLSRQTALNHGEIGARVGLTTRQVVRIAQSQQRRLSPETEWLAQRPWTARPRPAPAGLRRRSRRSGSASSRKRWVGGRSTRRTATRGPFRRGGDGGWRTSAWRHMIGEAYVARHNLWPLRMQR